MSEPSYEWLWSVYALPPRFNVTLPARAMRRSFVALAAKVIVYVPGVLKPAASNASGTAGDQLPAVANAPPAALVHLTVIWSSIQALKALTRVEPCVSE